MAMKFLVTFLLLISIGEIYSRTLLDKIRDDSDLSQVSETFFRFYPKTTHKSCVLWIVNQSKITVDKRNYVFEKSLK